MSKTAEPGQERQERELLVLDPSDPGSRTWDVISPDEIRALLLAPRTLGQAVGRKGDRRGR